MKKLDFARFKNPPSKYRSLPFWAWNDSMDENEIRRQICEMKRSGIGGFFIHSRDGLETEYLSPEWFDCVKAAVDEAKINGMDVWLYDEDRWPSGSCGGKVHGCKGLTLEVCNETCDDENILAIYASEIDGMEIRSLRRIDANSEVYDNETVLVARIEESDVSPWFNNFSPPDNMSKTGVKRFIDNTHEKYKECIGSEMGKAVKGIFTDEPGLADRHASFDFGRGWIPWTDDFEKYYKDKRNYDVFETLPYIYFEHKMSRKARHDYWRTVGECFLENYSGQISKWCKNNNIAYTGHFLQENRMGLVCRVSGCIMPHYALQDIPGIDMLTDSREEYITVKQCVSVANQLGKEAVLSEMYGCTGWDFDFEGQRRIGEWQYVLGVNRRCQHLALYSLRGCRKRDYPPSINCNAPWWKYYNNTEDYFARLGYVLSCGKANTDVLLIHPMSTVWSCLGCSPYGNPIRAKERDVPAMDSLGNRLNELIKDLCKKHYNCDLGDEMIIAEHGDSAKGKFIIGECEYSTVVVPFCETLLSSTVELLIEFASCGGRVISVAPHTKSVQCENSVLIDKLHNQPGYIMVDSIHDIYGYLQKNAVSITDENGNENENILHMLRSTEDGHILYIVNLSGDLQTVNINTEMPGKIYCADASDGEIYRGERCIQLVPYGSKLLYISECEIKCGKDLYWYRDKCDEIEMKLCGYCTDTKNVLTLDVCRYRMDGTSSMPKEVWQAQCEIRERLGMRQINLNGIEQRYRWINVPHENDGAELELEFEFESDCRICGAELVLERAEEFDILLDSKLISNHACGYFFDKSFECIKLPDMDKGLHTIVLRCRYMNDFELENCYIIGDFGVSDERVITVKPDEITLGDIGKYGFYHYAGGMEYCFECIVNEIPEDGVYLDISGFDGICAEAAVNGAVVAIPWKSSATAEVSRYLKIGKNEIRIKVCAGLRNMLGPFHLKNNPKVTRDKSFCAEGEEYTSEYMTVKVGLNKAKLYM